MSGGFTPGPWMARTTRDDELAPDETAFWMVLSANSFVNEGDALICSVNTYGGEDAHLIAAAPDLYAALKQAHEVVRDEWMVALRSYCITDAGGCPDLSTLEEADRPYVLRLQDTMERARLALAKARGEA